LHCYSAISRASAARLSAGGAGKTRATEGGLLKTVNFNINNYVKVCLTDYGRKCLRKNYNQLKAEFGGKLPYSYTPPIEDEGGWSRWQLWALMEDLGPYISITNSPFETIIQFEIDENN
jgi:repressor LexA